MLSYPLSYPEPVRHAFDNWTRRGEPLELPRIVPVPDTPVWIMRDKDDSMVNCVVLEGPHGLVLFGTGANYRQGQAIAKAIAAHSTKPIRTVVYGERRDDHCSGTRGILSAQQIGRVPVIALDTWQEQRTPHFKAVASVLAVRAAMQYGHALREAGDRTSDMNRRLSGVTPGPLVTPTVRARLDQEMKLAGLRIRFFATDSGENAELGLYLASHRLAVVSTEIHACPTNLTSLEGARADVSANWQRMVAQLSALDIEHLVGTRVSPLQSAEKVRGMLTTYRDFMDYLHDQAVRHMLAGASAEDVLERVPIPAQLLSGPFSRPFYGHFLGTAAQYPSGYLGWFSGHAVDLAPTPRRERASRSIALMGGAEQVLEAAREALNSGDPQWAAELARLVVDADPHDSAGRGALASALRTLGHAEANPLRRNWYYSAALEVAGELRLSQVRDVIDRPEAMPAHAILDGLRFRVVPEAAEGTTVSIGVELSDTEETFGLQLRSSVLRVSAGTPTEWSAGMRLTRAALVELAFGESSLKELVGGGVIEIQGHSGPVEDLWNAIEPRPELFLHLR